MRDIKEEKEELEDNSEMLSVLRQISDKLDTLEDLDTSIDYLTSVLSGEDAFSVGLRQKFLGRGAPGEPARLKKEIKEFIQEKKKKKKKRKVKKKKKKSTKLCARGKAAAKAKFDVYPSAYANGYAVQVCKGTKPGLDGKKRAASGYTKKESIVKEGNCGCGTCDACSGGKPEGGMALSQLMVLSKEAQELSTMFTQNSDLPEWVESKITKASDYISMVRRYMQGEMLKGTPISEELKYHLDNGIPLTEMTFRPGSIKFFSLFREARKLMKEGKFVPTVEERELLEEHEIGEIGLFEGRKVPLDFPMKEEVLEEAKYKGKNVKLGAKNAKRSGSGRAYVYTTNPKTGKVIKVSFGSSMPDAMGKGEKARKRRKAFGDRHDCAGKKDRTKPGYWACRATKMFGRSIPGWW